MRNTITFDNGNHAVVVTARCDTDAQTILKSLGIAQPHALIMVFGGAKGLDDSRKACLAELFTSAVAPAAAEVGALVIDGGTQAGVMAMMGEAFARNGGESQLLGIAPAGKVTYPGGPNDSNIGDGAPLEPNHSHFVLVESDEWGGETSTMFKLAQALNVAVVTMLINGGQIAENEALRTVRNGWPLLVVEGSGRFADELSAVARNTRLNTSATIQEITRSGRVKLFSIDKPALGLKSYLQQILAAG
jgi:SLOG in TRPM, prokaryote